MTFDQVLARLCFQEPAEIGPTTKDRYGRTIARVFCNGEDVSMTMVREGYAWAYVKYLTDARVVGAEMLARKEHAGLWADKIQIAPWVWRHQ